MPRAKKGSIATRNYERVACGQKRTHKRVFKTTELPPLEPGPGGVVSHKVLLPVFQHILILCRKVWDVRRPCGFPGTAAGLPRHSDSAPQDLG